MVVVSTVLYLIVFIYFLLLMARLVLDWVQVFARDWKPQGFLLVVAELIYSVTDPPIRLVRKVIPPLRMGPIALDLGFMVVLLVCLLLMSVLSRL